MFKGGREKLDTVISDKAALNYGEKRSSGDDKKTKMKPWGGLQGQGCPGGITGGANAF
jgi:hypothetical protein